MAAHGYNSHEERALDAKRESGGTEEEPEQVFDICQRWARGNFPVAKLVPFIGKDASEQDLLLVAVGKMRLPQIRLE
jgi:hypothetical protein